MNLLVFALIGVALGLALGLFGGGGGILAIPLLIAAGVPADEAGTTALIVVGIGAIGGLIPHARAGRVDWGEGLTFGALGTAGAVAGSMLALRTDDHVQLVAFAILLVIAGVLMLRNALRTPSDAAVVSNTGTSEPGPEGPGAQGPTPGSPAATAPAVLEARPNTSMRTQATSTATPSVAEAAVNRDRAPWPLIVVTALGVGLLTGFFGVGGGFLVVPALTLVLGMSIHRATATALLVIVINSAAAFVPRATEALDVPAAVTVTIGVLIASAVAAQWSNRWSRRSLGIGFAVLVLAMSVLTMTQAAVN